MRSRIVLALLLGSVTGAAEPRAFLEKHCFECHDGETKKGGLDLTALRYDAAKPEKWIQLHDAVADGEMPPAKKKSQPTASERSAFVAALGAQLTADVAAAHPTRSGLRRLTRQEFENSLKDLLALPRLDITSLLPADGRVSGYDKIASGLDLSPGHLAAYQEAIEKALDVAIATQSAAPRVYQKRIYPAGLFKFGGNLAHGQFVLLKDKQPDPALPVRGGFEDKKGHVGHEGPDLAERSQRVKSPAVAQSRSAVGLLNPNLAGYEAAMNVAPIYAGNYRLRLSIWGFRWAEEDRPPAKRPKPPSCAPTKKASNRKAAACSPPSRHRPWSPRKAKSSPGSMPMSPSSSTLSRFRGTDCASDRSPGAP